ncbi:MAG: ribbon-helix-helix protein, CopG family [Candidatus Woesearchaeota archaeon]
MTRKTTSIKIDPELWKRVKKHCIDRDMDISDFIEQLLKKNLPK